VYDKTYMGGKKTDSNYINQVGTYIIYIYIMFMNCYELRAIHLYELIVWLIIMYIILWYTYVYVRIYNITTRTSMYYT